MKIKKILLLICVLIFAFPCIGVFSYKFSEPHYNQNGVSVYFLTSLDTNDVLIVNVTHGTEDGPGNFSLFLFDRRPTESFINVDSSLDPKIFNYAINYSLDYNPFINYTSNSNRIHYIQIILLANGPDLFIIQSNRNLTRYYLPIIPGFQVSIMIPVLVSTIVIIPIIIRKRIIK